MMRKLLTALMCLFLALALPMASLAATEYEISVVPGAELASIDAVKDMLDVLSLRFLSGSESGMFALVLNNTEMLHLAMRATGDGVYVESAELGDAPFFFAKEDITAQMSALMEQSGAKPEMAEALTQNFDLAFSQIGSPSDATTETEADTAAAAENPEEQLAKLEEMFANDPALGEFVTNVLDSFQMTEGTYTDPAHDDAGMLFELKLTSADMKKLMESTTVQKMLAAYSDSNSEKATAEFSKMLDQLDISIPMSVYMSAENGEPVAFRIPLTAKGAVEVTSTEDGKTTTETKEVDIAVTMDYNRLTKDTVANHNVSIILQNKGKEMAKSECTVTADKAAGQYDMVSTLSGLKDDVMTEIISAQGSLATTESGSHGWFGILASKSQLTLDFTTTHTGDVSDKSIAVYTRADAEKIIAPSASDRPLFTLKAKVTHNASEDALNGINAATPDASTQVLKMSSEEQSSFFTDIQTKIMQLGMSIISQLPASVVTLFTGNNQ